MSLKEDYVLYLCERTSYEHFNSGIQRVTRLLASSMISNGVKLVPVGFGGDKVYLLGDSQLETLSLFGGPKKDSWYIPNIENWDEFCNDSLCFFSPELNSGPTIQEYSSIMLNFFRNKKIKVFWIFYDAIPVLFKELYSSQSNQGWSTSHLNYMQAMSQADGVLSISQQSTSDFISIVGEANNIKTIGLPNVFPEMERIAPKINNTNNIEMLMVSSIEPRKNHISAVKALQKINSKLLDLGINIKFNIVGASIYGEIVNEIKNNYKELNINFTGSVSDEDLINYYKDADFTIYTSLYEGYGLPVAESLYLNTPSICSNNSAITDFAKDGGCIMFDPNNIDDIAEKIFVMSKDSITRKKLIKEIENIRQYTWEQYAEDVYDFIKEEK